MGQREDNVRGAQLVNKIILARHYGSESAQDRDCSRSVSKQQDVTSDLLAFRYPMFLWHVERERERSVC